MTMIGGVSSALLLLLAGCGLRACGAEPPTATRARDAGGARSAGSVSPMPELVWLTPYSTSMGSLGQEPQANRVELGRSHRFAHVKMSLAREASGKKSGGLNATDWGELFAEPRSGRELWLRGTVFPSNDERRALLVRHTNHMWEADSLGPNSVFARFVSLDTGVMSEETELASANVAVDEEVRVAVLTLAGVATPLTWVEAARQLPMGRNGAVLLDVESLRPCTRLNGEAGHCAVVASDGSRALYVTREPTEDVVHVFSPTKGDEDLSSAGARVTALTWSVDLRTLGAGFSSGHVETYRDGKRVASFAKTVRGPLGVSADGTRIAWRDRDLVEVDDGSAKPPLVMQSAKDPDRHRASLVWDSCLFAFGRETLELEGDTLLARPARLNRNDCPTRVDRYDLVARKGVVETSPPPPLADQWAKLCEPGSVAEDATWVGCVGRDGRFHLWSSPTGAPLYTGALDTAERVLVGTAFEPLLP